MVSVPRSVESWLPAATLVLLGLIVGLVARTWLGRKLEIWAKRTPWRWDDVLVDAIRWPMPILALLLGVEAGAQAAPIGDVHRAIVHRVVVPLETIVITWMVADAAQGLIKTYAKRHGQDAGVAPVLQQVVLVVIAGTGCLYFLSAIGISPTPILLVLAIAAGVAALAVRNVLPDLFAGLSLNAGFAVKRGDRIRVDSIEGVVTQVGWRTTTVRSERGDHTIIPNSRIVSAVVIRRPRDAKRLDGNKPAKTPLELRTRVTLPELTGRRAATLREFTDELEHAPISCIHQHSLVYVTEHDYLTPTPVSDFARWVTETLRLPALGERFGSIDPCVCGTLSQYRDKLVALCRAAIATQGDGVRVPPGSEFFFLKSRVFVFSTHRTIHTLRELADGLRTVPTTALYVHLFEARLGLDLPAVDLLSWIEDNYGDTELAGALATLDPYTRTAEGLRNAVIALLEERIGA